MSSASRDEGGRSRRRRRRGPSAAAAARQNSDRPPPSPAPPPPSLSPASSSPAPSSSLPPSSAPLQHTQLHQHPHQHPSRRSNIRPAPSHHTSQHQTQHNAHPPNHTTSRHAPAPTAAATTNPATAATATVSAAASLKAAPAAPSANLPPALAQSSASAPTVSHDPSKSNSPEQPQPQPKSPAAPPDSKEKDAHTEKERRTALLNQIAKRQRERHLNLAFVHLRPGDDAPAQRLSDSELRQLDSSLKKCTGFLRKIRTAGVTDDSVPALLAEAESLNLSRYISEVVSAIADGKLRAADIEHVLALCAPLHRRYEDFTPQLVSAFSAVVLAAAPAKDSASRKTAMRLLVEMYVIALYSDINHITNALRQLMRAARDSKEEHLATLGVIASFVRASSGTLLPKRANEHVTLLDIENNPQVREDLAWQEDVAPPATKSNIVSALQSYLESDVDRLVKETLQDFEKASANVARSRQLRDSADDALAAAFDTAKQAYEKTLTSANVIAEAVERSPYTKQLLSPNASSTPDSTISGDTPSIFVSNPFNNPSRARLHNQEMDVLLNADHPFESDEQRMFYTELIAVSERRNGDGDRKGRADRSRPIESDGRSATASRSDEKSRPSQKPSEFKKKANEKPIPLDRLLGRLSSTETKEAADVFVQSFISSRDGTRNGTKRLTKALISVPPQKLNVLAAYSRIAASLQPVCSDVGSAVASHLEEDIRHFVGRADIDEKSLASCMKTALYIGEYVKFGLIPSTTLFELLAVCMKDFSGHRVDVACHLLEACGRYVYRTPSTHPRMATILDTIWRVKSVKNLEARHNTLIETAFYSVRLSPGSKAQKIKRRPPLQEYIRHLIYFRLDASNISWTKNQLLKLPWEDDIEDYVMKKFVKVSRARYSNIPHIASLLAALQKYKPMLCVSVVDALLESIRSGMEKNDGRESQKRIAEICLLGELNRTGIVDSKVIYNVLYLIITLGHENPDHNQLQPKKVESSVGVVEVKDELSAPRPINGVHAPAPDPPGDFFRIRLTCVLLETCGAVLASSYQRKLEVFWVYFDRYLFCKTIQAGFGDRIPLHIDHLLDDVLENMWNRPKRAGKEGRSSLRDTYSRSDSMRRHHEHGWHTPHNRSIKRSRTIEDALRSVMAVERSAADLALISTPMRSVSNLTQTSKDGRLNQTLPSSHGKVRSTIVGNVKDGFRTTSVREMTEVVAERLEPHREEVEPGNGESGSEEATSGFEEDGSRDDVSSGDEEMCESSNMSDMDVDDEDDEDEDEDDDEDDDEEDEDDDEDDDDDDDDEIVLKMQRPKTEEEEAFAKELEAMTAAAVQDARATSSRATKLDRMAIPMSLMTKKLEEERAAAASLAASAIGGDESDDSEVEEGSSRRRKKRGEQQSKCVEFKVLLRKGGKSQLQDLKVPASSSLAVAAKESETADAMRHEETRRLVLESSIVQNEEQDDFEEEVPLRVHQHLRTKEENIRQQRSADEMELLATLNRPRTRR